MITLDKLLTELSSSSLNEIIAGHGHTIKKTGSHSNKKSNSNKSGKNKNKKKKNGATGNGCCDSRSVIVLAPE